MCDKNLGERKLKWQAYLNNEKERNQMIKGNTLSDK